jgi:hypothetical protein
MAAGDTVAGWIVSWQDPIRGVVSVPISEQPSYEGGSTFMHGIVGRALGRWYDVTGAARVRDACIGIAEWITTEPMGKPGQFWYKQSPNNSKRYGATDQCLTALTYASVLSGDPWFETVATALLRQTRAGGRSISWYPQALAQLLPSITPAAVEVTPGELDVAPDRPGAVEVSVRNTTDVELTAAVTAATPAPFRLAQPPVEFTVPAGATGTGHVGIACTAAPGSGTVVLRVRLTSAGQPAAERILPVVVRAVKRIVRIEAGVAAAQVSAPMVVAGQAVEAYAHTPRRADFVAKPHAPDGAVGGAATWTLELPVETEYELSAEVKWRDDEGNSFYLSVDGGPEQVLGNTGAMNQWLWVAQPRVRLTAGRHTFRIRSREDGAQVRRICLSGVEAE